VAGDSVVFSGSVSAFAEASRDVAVELYELFAELDRGRLKRESLSAMRTRLHAVRGKVSTLKSSGPALGAPAELGSELSRLDALLDAHTPERDARGEWLTLRQRVQPTYERIASALSREDIHVPSLRPTNYARNVLHVSSAAFALSALELAPSWTVAIAIAAGFAAVGISLEIGRRLSARVNDFCMWLFGRTAHPHEAHRVNSATWYAIAVLLMALCQQVVPSAIALVVLGIGDPCAAIVGRRWGRIRLVNGRSLEGTLAFVLTGGLAALGFVALAHPALGLGSAALVTLVGAAAGALAELFSRRIDDNFSVPLTAFAASYVVLASISQ
jgi:dolichol kinase